MAEIGDKYVLTLTCYLGGALDNPLINVFAYEATEGEPSALGVNGAFIADVVPALADVLIGDLLISDVQAVNLDDVADFAETEIGVNGTVAGQYLNAFVGWEFEYLRGVRTVHNGRKTFSGVPEASVDNGIANAGALTGLNALELALESAIVTGGVATTFIPRIWRRAGIYVSGTFPDTFYPINGVAYRRVSTQNSRKR